MEFSSLDPHHRRTVCSFSQMVRECNMGTLSGIPLLRHFCRTLSISQHIFSRFFFLFLYIYIYFYVCVHVWIPILTLNNENISFGLKWRVIIDTFKYVNTCNNQHWRFLLNIYLIDLHLLIVYLSLCVIVNYKLLRYRAH